jgi:hypothetical protein
MREGELGRASSGGQTNLNLDRFPGSWLIGSSRECVLDVDTM